MARKTRSAKPASFTVYFGEELARYREARGWSQDEFAEKVGWSVSLVRSIEQGRRKPPYGFGEKSDVLLGLDGRMTGLAKKAREERTQFGDYLDLESRAISIRIVDERAVPGLLQTPEYARAVLEASELDATPEAIEEQVQARVARKENAPPIHAVIDEAVLRRVFGGADVMRAQLHELAAPRPGFTIQVIPFDAGPHPATGGPIRILRVPDEPDVAFADGWTNGEIVDHPDEVLRAQRAFDHACAVALPPQASRKLILAYAEEL